MSSDLAVLDVFAGPGGWDEGLKSLNLYSSEEVLGVELDELACATAEAAGHRRLQADVTKLDPLDFSGIAGLIGSPPCQGFSTAGKGLGRIDSYRLLDVLDTVNTLEDLVQGILFLQEKMFDPRSLLVLEPLRYALILRPKWIALEQVPTVLPIWQKLEAVLRKIGYTAETGLLSAEQFGVAQTRKRAFLVARSEEFSVQDGPAWLPDPTHSRFNIKTPDKLDPGLPKAVSISEAVGHNPTFSGPRWRPGGLGLGPSEHVWQFAGAGATARTTAGQIPRDMSMPAHTITGKATAVWTRKTGDVGSGVRVTVAESSVLQSFPADYPWAGKATTEHYRMLGDAVPPRLAAAVLNSVINPNEE